MKSQRSYWKCCTVYNHLEEFIKYRYKVSDIALRELSLRIHYRFRVVPSYREESLHQYRMVVYDAVPQYHIYRYQ